MDAKNAEALTYGPEYMLDKFVNLPDEPGDTKPAEEFRERFGELFPGLDPEHYWIDVAEFRKAWHATSVREKEAVGRYLSNLFNRRNRPHVKQPSAAGFGVLEAVLARDPRYHASIGVDYSSGESVLTATATLLDWLASWLLHLRRSLAICKREGCTARYFVKTHPRTQYCSESCFRESRLEQKNKWWVRNRGKGSKTGRKKTHKGGRR
ncbi:MAG TPA: hypothetical protein VFB23_03360 [Candidatus Acidoferrales bacterium]|nr:hypothetical protein [Candidatus Acidoferrales bacterium]